MKSFGQKDRKIPKIIKREITEITKRNIQSPMVRQKAANIHPGTSQEDRINRKILIQERKEDNEANLN